MSTWTTTVCAIKVTRRVTQMQIKWGNNKELPHLICKTKNRDGVTPSLINIDSENTECLSSLYTFQTIGNRQYWHEVLGWKVEDKIIVQFWYSLCSHRLWRLNCHMVVLTRWIILGREQSYYYRTKTRLHCGSTLRNVRKWWRHWRQRDPQEPLPCCLPNNNIGFDRWPDRYLQI